MRGVALGVVLAALIHLAPPVEAEPPAGRPHTTDPPLVVCLAGAADGSPVVPLTEVPAGFRAICVAFHLAEGANPKVLTSVWTAVSVGDAAAPNTELARKDLTLGTARRGTVSYTLPRDMPAGAYRLDTLLDGAPWASTGIRVVAGPKPLPASGSDARLPLTDGTAWSYDFTMTPGEGVKLSLPGVEPGSDGVLRARGRYVVAGHDERGAHVLIQRNEATVLEEWWTSTDYGLFVTRRKQGDQVEDLDPPQPIWPQFPGATFDWTWRPDDGGPRQVGRAWRSVDVETPDGTRSGTAVLVVLAGTSGATSIERLVVPGLGLVREVLTAARADAHLLYRTDLRLAKPR